MDVKEFRLKKGLGPKELVQVVREIYPCYDRYLQSKVEHPEKYGIRLLQDAEDEIVKTYSKTADAPRKPEKRRLRCRLTVRTTKKVYAQLQRVLKRKGFETVQAGLTHIINAYLENADGHR